MKVAGSGFRGLRRIGFIALLASMALMFSVPAHAADSVRLKLAMNGHQVVGGGDPDGAGAGRLVIYPSDGRVCYSFSAKRIYYAWSVQLHRGTRGNDGPVVLDLKWPGWDGRWSGCENGVSQALLEELAQNPRGFYVDVHTCEYWFGAIRGQLAVAR
jgi:hypothetical protein